ncbi:MAG: Gfo/Idh/MocA family oxidoreductase, partial [Pyrinomonadaceae bacterium]
MVGAGKMAREHLRTLKAFRGVRLVGVCSRGGASAAELAREFGVEQTFQ